jgi:predicted peptidase
VTYELVFLERVMGTPNGVRETPAQRSFLAQTFTGSRGQVLPYRMLVPPAYPAHSEARGHDVDRERMPLVLLLHGAGERGNDNSAQLSNGVAELLGSDTATVRFPCLYVVPQCPTKHRWAEADWDAERHVLRLEPSLPLSTAVELLDALLHRHSIDPQRLYLIGLSMGGFGVWDLLSRWPERFAAAVPICGGADERAVVAARAVPVWAFHGALDPAVPVERSRRAVAALREAGGTPRYTEYPNVGHDAWTHAFTEPNLLPWLFSHRRSTT